MLAEKDSIEPILQSVCEGVQRALAFEKVMIELVDPVNGLLVPRAAVGWPGEAPRWEVTLEAAAGLMDPAFEIGGCFLLSHEAGALRAARVQQRPVADERARALRMGPPLALRPALRPGRRDRRAHLGRRSRRPRPTPPFEGAARGVRRVRQPREDGERLIRRADAALYERKRARPALSSVTLREAAARRA
jgi:hypothetical protein